MKFQVFSYLFILEYLFLSRNPIFLINFKDEILARRFSSPGKLFGLQFRNKRNNFLKENVTVMLDICKRKINQIFLLRKNCLYPFIAFIEGYFIQLDFNFNFILLYNMHSISRKLL